MKLKYLVKTHISTRTIFLIIFQHQVKWYSKITLRSLKKWQTLFQLLISCFSNFKDRIEPANTGFTILDDIFYFAVIFQFAEGKNGFLKFEGKYQHSCAICAEIKPQSVVWNFLNVILWSSLSFTNDCWFSRKLFYV